MYVVITVLGTVVTVAVVMDPVVGSVASDEDDVVVVVLKVISDTV